MNQYHIIKRTGVSAGKRFCYYLIAIAIALIIGAILLLSLKVNPLSYYAKMLTIGTIAEDGTLSRFAYKQVESLVKMFIPLLLTSVALSVAFRMRFWNIGGEGQFLIGSVAAAFIPLRFGVVGSTGLTLLLMAVAAMVAGGIWGGVIALLKVKFGTNETLMTLMFNYIALYFVAMLGEEKRSWNIFLSPESQRPIFRSVWEVVEMPAIKIGKFSLSYSLIIALLICAFIWFYLKKTKHGYEISVVGDSIGTAHYAGMKVNRIIVRTMLLSSAMIGLAGFFKLTSAGPLSTSLTDSAGWTGIVVAWLAKLDTVGILVTSLLISILRFGCAQASITHGAIDSRFSDLLQGVILFAVLVADFLIRFKIVKKEDA